MSRALSGVLLISLLALSGCGAASTAPSSVEDLIIDWSESAPPFQKEILADGVVDPSEYEKAIIANRDCVDAAGYEVGDLSWSMGQLGFTAEADYSSARDPAKADEEFLNTTQLCEDEYSFYVAQAWALQISKVTPAERQKDREAVIECLDIAGLELSGNESDEDIYQLTNQEYEANVEERVLQCVQQHSRFFTSVIE